MYLARPCQYGAMRHCEQKYWTVARYAPEILEAIGDAIDQLKRKTGATHLVLVGYSGGGAIAVLEAARRDDVSRIITIAANLDLGFWTSHYGLSPLSQSLDPAFVAKAVSNIPQTHYTGEKDDTVGTNVVKSFVSKMPEGSPVQVIEIPNFTHNCCWEFINPLLFTENDKK